MRHLRTTLDVGDQTALDALLLRAQELKRHRGQRRMAPTLAGRVIAMLFEKPSTRTRVSFQSGAALLGAHCVVLEGRDIWLSRDEAAGGEALRDTARVIGGAVDLLVVRPQGPHATVEELARHAGVPVVNGLSDRDHPCQVLTDLFTLYERRERPFQSVVAFVGDSVAMANGYLALASLSGLEVRLALPEGAAVDGELLRRAQARAKILVTADPKAAVAGADVVSTAAWSGPVADGFLVDDALLALASDDVTVLHPLPARRGQEITDDVLEGPRSVAFQQGLAALQAGGGGDEPEALNEALHTAVHRLSWRGGDATRLVLLVADAPPHLDYGAPWYDDDMQGALARGIKLLTIGASGLDRSGEYVFRQLAQYTGGRFVFLTYADARRPGSGPGRETVHDVDNYSVQTLDRLVVRLVREELARRPG